MAPLLFNLIELVGPGASVRREKMGRMRNIDRCLQSLGVRLRQQDNTNLETQWKNTPPMENKVGEFKRLKMASAPAC